MTESASVGFVDPTPYLLPGETVRLVVRRHHPIVLAPVAALSAVVVIGVLAALLLSAPTPEMLAGAGVIVLGTLLYFGYRYIHWSRTVLVVTNRRLFQLVSLGIKRVTVMPVMRQAIVFRQTPIGRALGFASVQVRTANGSVLYDFNLLADATRFRDEVTNIAA